MKAKWFVRRIVAREQLWERLEPKLATFGRIRDSRMTTARGYWTHAHQDVRQVEGTVQFEGSPRHFTFGSWSSATDLLRRGFEVQDCRTHGVIEVDFEILALGGKERRAE